PVVAAWLRQLGHEACVLEGGAAAAAALTWRRAERLFASPAPRAMTPREVVDAIGDDAVQIIDLRPSMAYRKGHIPQALWSIRPRIAAAVADRTKIVLLVADDAGIAALAALDLAEAGITNIRLLEGGHEAWRAAGLPVAATPNRPADGDCVDFLFFTHARH